MNGIARCRRFSRFSSSRSFACSACSASSSGASPISASRLSIFSTSLRLGRRSASRRRQALPHRAQHVEVGDHAVGGIAGAPGLGELGVLQRRLDEVGQLQILEQEIEELLFRQREGEIVLAVAVLGALAAAAALPALRLVDAVAGDELLVAGQHPLAVAAAVGVVEHRLVDAVGRDRNRSALGGVADRALAHRLVDRLLDARARPFQEAHAVAETFVARIEAAVDELGHRSIVLDRAHPALLTRMYHSTSRRTCRSV